MWEPGRSGIPLVDDIVFRLRTWSPAEFSEFARQRSAAGGFATPFKAMKEMEEALIGKKKAKEKK